MGWEPLGMSPEGLTMAATRNTPAEGRPPGLIERYRQELTVRHYAQGSLEVMQSSVPELVLASPAPPVNP